MDNNGLDDEEMVEMTFKVPKDTACQILQMSHGQEGWVPRYYGEDKEERLNRLLIDMTDEMYYSFFGPEAVEVFDKNKPHSYDYWSSVENHKNPENPMPDVPDGLDMD